MRRLTLTLSVLLTLALFATPALADHNGAQVAVTGGECEPTVISATVADAQGTHLVDNMRLVVDDGTTVEVSDPIPTDGSAVGVSVGPYTEETLVLWRIFGGSERDYDQPAWNTYGEPGFTDAINDYATSVGGFDWVLSGFDDDNPFTTWSSLTVAPCLDEEPDTPDEKDVCKQSGWQSLDFRNQGQCIRFINTGKDSRDDADPASTSRGNGRGRR
ncbi:MAG: hypothetical protein WD011_01425 [Nitriliruptoraceae bacterium]